MGWRPPLLHRLDYQYLSLLHTHMRMSLPREMNTPFQGGGPIVLEIKINLSVLAIFNVI